MPEGTVKWFNARKGFGFIKVDGQNEDVFVHANELASVGAERELFENQRVEFTIEKGQKGPCAKNVKVIG
jgi:CspA family cold shock protein